MTRFCAWWDTTARISSSGRMSWTDLTPPEWRDRDARAVARTEEDRNRASRYEKEYFRKDGSRVPVLVGAASFEEGGN